MQTVNWKEDFLRLYTSEKVDDYGEALDLKRKHIPTKLYRYRPLDNKSMAFRMGEIVRGELYLSHPKDLNDPFEVSSLLHSSNPSDYLHAKEEFVKTFEGRMDPDTYSRIFSKENFFDELMDFAAENSILTEPTLDIKKVLTEVIMSEFAKLNSYINTRFRNSLRFACFSTTGINLPMWHHYTNGHSGICLEFDTNKIQNIYQLNMLFPVYYVEKLPDMTHMMVQRTHPRFSTIKYQAIHKLKDWSYENEWRLIFDPGAWYYSEEDIPDEYWNQGKTIQFIKPSRVLLGMNILPEHEETVREYAQLAGIPATKTKKTEYGLQIE